MAQRPFVIELRNSALLAVLLEEGTAVIKLRPACIHRDKRVWRQDLDILVARAEVNLGGVILPANLIGGTMESGAARVRVQMEAPMHLPNRVTVSLESASGAVVCVSGVGVSTVLYGQAISAGDATQ